ncbi:LacI family DNA-binding transcriptional regulator [Duganella sp. FT109W]|uniref:LacI family DNA-binding transcriptional regulator n=1 Tax=Duganella margarita TaxID=2692170 RepID=A0ABW9WH34_9BURK|nr:LacI family DNA-binding transcriptional regulator [Duganella margarita]
MAAAYDSHAYTLTEIARHFGVSLMTASRAVKKRS